jgi:galactose oxidase
MSARKPVLLLILIAVFAAACNTKPPVQPVQPVQLEIPVEPVKPVEPTEPVEIPLDTSTLEVETAAPNSHVSTGSANSNNQGVWSAKITWPTLAIHAALMPDKTVITWGWRRQWNLNHGEDPVHYQICKTWTDTWDSTQALEAGHSSAWYGAGVIGNGLSYPITCPNPNNTDMFGAGHAHTPDGQLFVAGGMGVGPTITANTGNPWDGVYYGVKNTNSYDPVTHQWQPGPRLNRPRWYPTVTTLSDGQMLVSGGSDATFGSFGLPNYAGADGNLDLHERLEGDALKGLNGARMRVPYYPWMIVTPRVGMVLEAGPQSQMRFLDPNGAGDWIDGRFNRSDNSFRGYGSLVPIIDLRSSDANDWTAKAFAFGGGGEPDLNGNRTNPDCAYRKAEAGTFAFNPGRSCVLASKSSSEINLRDGSSMAKADLKRGRRNLNGVALPNGQVLAVGGNEYWNNRGAQHFTPELYDPGTDTWTDLSAQKGIRNYHSTALLLPDASVLSMGGYYDRNFDQDSDNTEGDANARNSKDAEIFYPPYLFGTDGQPTNRPWIRAAPKSIKYGQDFLIGTPDADKIGQVNLIKLGATTHSFDADQRLVKIGFSRGTQRLSIHAPANGTFAPPGHYMLFIIDDRGVPSVARILKLEL